MTNTVYCNALYLYLFPVSVPSTASEVQDSFLLPYYIRVFFSCFGLRNFSSTHTTTQWALIALMVYRSIAISLWLLVSRWLGFALQVLSLQITVSINEREGKTALADQFLHSMDATDASSLCLGFQFVVFVFEVGSLSHFNNRCRIFELNKYRSLCTYWKWKHRPQWRSLTLKCRGLSCSGVYLRICISTVYNGHEGEREGEREGGRGTGGREGGMEGWNTIFTATL